MPEIGKVPPRPEMLIRIPHGHETEEGYDAPEIMERGESITSKIPGEDAPEIKEEFVPDIEEKKKEKDEKKPSPQPIIKQRH